MTTLTRRKPVLWILVDLVATLILLGGFFKLFEMEIPFISDIFRSFPASLLLGVGGIMLVVSMLMFILPVIKADKANNTDTVSAAVERSKR